ncbi:MAG: SUMF1/EgtB/PvdO family nonheme iron enzyme [Pseudomonadota bacterium]
MAHRVFSISIVALFCAAAACAPGSSEDDSAVGAARDAAKDSACNSAPIGESVYVAGGPFKMGDDSFYPEERPVVDAGVGDFWIDATEVTNAQFAEFVSATGYVTRAERGLAEESFADLPDEMRRAGSVVFVPPLSNENASPATWWRFIEGAYWRAPEGPGSSITGKDNHPVVHIAIEDAAAYAAWKGRRLPSEAEWEYAAAEGALAPALGAPPPEANTWQGFFPFVDTQSDGYSGASPVGCFQPNSRGVFDMMGNVWELTTSPYYPSHDNETLTAVYPDGYDPVQPGVALNVIKGGSHLCAENFCRRYRAQSRQPQDAFLATSHIGFRTVADAAPSDG